MPMFASLLDERAILARVLLPRWYDGKFDRWPDEITIPLPCLRNPSSANRRCAAAS